MRRVYIYNIEHIVTHDTYLISFFDYSLFSFFSVFVGKNHLDICMSIRFFSLKHTFYSFVFHLWLNVYIISLFLENASRVYYYRFTCLYGSNVLLVVICFQI